MQTFEGNVEDFTQGAQQRVDEQLYVKFFYKTVLDKAATEREGRPIHKEAEYIEIREPGKKDFFASPARPKHIKRFPRHYEAFKARTSQPETEGTLLTEWGLIPRSQAEDLSYLNIKTVEQLAGTNDSAAVQIMGFNTLKRKAQEWLEMTKNGSFSELRSELEKRDELIANQQTAIEEMQRQLAELQKPKRKRRTKAEIEADKAKEESE